MDRAVQNGKKSMKSGKRLRLIRWFFLAVMVLCLIPVGREFYLSIKHKEQRDALREKVEQSENLEISGGQTVDGIQASGRAAAGNGTGGTEAADSIQTADGTEAADGIQTADGTEAADSIQTEGGAGNATDGAEPEIGGGLQSGNGAGGNSGESEGAGRDADENSGETGGAGGDADGNGEESGRDENDGNGQQTAPHPAMLRKYAALKRENEHLAGWLLIEGRGIDYPVMQCEDDEYYLHHDFYGNDSKYGCLYVRERADLENGVNFIIYGHNMRDGAMFGNLDYYLKESFYKEHPFISFDTLYEERVYEIVAVFRSQVYRAEDDVFKYYQFYEADTVEEFEEFYTNIKALSIYDTGVEAEFGDTFLTCSTCAYHVEDGRFVVVAKRVE